MKINSFLKMIRDNHMLIESNVSDIPGRYKGLTIEALYSSCEDLVTIFSCPIISGDFVDLGSGIGHSVLLYNELYPNRKAIGIEIEDGRIKVGQSYKDENQLVNVSFIKADLLSVEIPIGQIYFLYFPTGPVLDRVLSELQKKDHEFHLVVIESHGDLIPRIELENWLRLETEVSLKSSRHFDKAKIYRRIFVPRSPELRPFDLSFKRFYLLIRNEQESWIGESYGMEWSNSNCFELLVPPRRIYWDSVEGILSFTDFSPLGQLLLELRKNGELQIFTQDNEFQGLIRKIFLEPKLTIEISSGEKLQLKDISKIYQDSRLCFDASFSLFSSFLVP